jgi:CubicO group peptidase (beta-lactamase class C family)
MRRNPRSHTGLDHIVTSLLPLHPDHLRAPPAYLSKKKGAPMSRLLLLVLALTMPFGLAQSQPRAPGLSADLGIRHLLAERIAARQDVGIVVGLIGPTGHRVIAHGSMAQGHARPVDGDTLFEIASVTKVFTTLALADMARRGEVALDDPVAKFLPPHVTMPARGRAITLLDLATHTSGLPRLPTNFAPRDFSNPYVDYSVAQLYEFLSGYALPRDVGAQYEYSNLGMGLLGHVLARRAGTDYERLVVSRIAKPLGMDSTRVTLDAKLRARLATGHNAGLEPVPNWDDTTLAGAGSLYASVNDLLRFLAAHLVDESSLTPAIATTLSVRKPADAANVAVALGWHVTTRDNVDLIWHNGGTGGYASFIGYSPQSGVGIVALSNSAAGVDDLALQLVSAVR